LESGNKQIKDSKSGRVGAKGKYETGGNCDPQEASFRSALCVPKRKKDGKNAHVPAYLMITRRRFPKRFLERMPEEERRPFHLYVDEFQNFATPDFAQILSEARKFRLALTVANQFIGQMEEEVKNAIFGNVGTLISFRVGVSDANYLQHELQPTISESDLINLERYNVYTKTIVNNEPQTPFSMNLMKDMDQVKSLESTKVAEMVKQLSRLKYGKDSDIIEAEIARRSKL